MLIISKAELKNYIGRKYILLLRPTLDDLVDAMNDLDQLTNGGYEVLGDIHCNLFFDFVIMKKSKMSSYIDQR